MSVTPESGKQLRFGWVDALVILAALSAIAWLGYRVDNVLNYSWSWNTVTPYIAYFDEERQQWVANLLVQGFLMTLRLAVLGIVVAAVIGIVMGLMRTSKNLFVRMVARTYVEFVRNMPPLVFIFIFYFFLSVQIVPLLGLDEIANSESPAVQWIVRIVCGDPSLFANFVSGLICLALFEGAYLTEIVRAGIQSIPSGQWEAGASVGLSRLAVMRLVIMPQAIARILPPLANQFITLIKDSSIVSLISIQELTFMAVEVGTSTTHVFETWITVAAAYFVVCFACARVLARMERRMGRGLN